MSEWKMVGKHVFIHIQKLISKIIKGGREDGYKAER